MIWNLDLPEPIILYPRPLERKAAGILLVPLLPFPSPLKPLPAEIWSKIFSFVCYDLSCGREPCCINLLTICKSLTGVASPVFFSRVSIHTTCALEQFTRQLHSADQKWDSIRRIQYSAPGRWVQSLDLSKLDCKPDILAMDELLTRLFPLLPFMARLVLDTSLVLSRRALDALTFRDGTQNLRVLKGIRAPLPVSDLCHDPLVQLIQHSTSLEELEIFGPGFDPADIEFSPQFTDSQFDIQISMRNLLRLNNLTTLSILSTHSSPLMYALLVTNLPSLRRLSITPYDDIPHPMSLVSLFIQVHGPSLNSLYLYTPRDIWPTIFHPSPKDILITCPNINHLSLEYPLPKLTLPSRQQNHPLQIISIPRAKSEYFSTIERMAVVLQNFKVVRTRDVRWLRGGMTPRALEAGVQGEMRDWRRRLLPKGIIILDADNKDMTET